MAHCKTSKYTSEHFFVHVGRKLKDPKDVKERGQKGGDYKKEEEKQALGFSSLENKSPELSIITFDVV